MAAVRKAHEAYLLGLPRYSQIGNEAMKPGLRGVKHLLEPMGRPERRLKCVHVAGTNGKGSTASMIASIAQAAGLRTALFTSPHLVDMTERIRINGKPIADAVLDDALKRNKATFDRLQPSFFEAITALAFLCFAEAEVDLAIIETGLGGRLDATNIIQPAACVITEIALDHESTLGRTLTSIAREKGGIIKPGIPVVAQPGAQEVRDVLQAIAQQQQAPWHEAGTIQHEGDRLWLRTPVRTYENVRCGIPGQHQPFNALLALRVSELVIDGLVDHPDWALNGLANTAALSGLRGRLESLQLRPHVVLDVAHNPSSICAALDHMGQSGTLHVVLSLMRDKNVAAIAPLLTARNARVFTCDLDSPRAWPSAALAKQLAELGVQIGGFGLIEDLWPEICSLARPRDSVLICGSHQLAGAFLVKNATDQLALCV